MKVELSHAGLTQIFVYPPGTEPGDFKPKNACKSGKKPSRETDDDNPMIVVAQPPPQRNGEDNLRFFHSFVVVRPFYC